MDSYTVLILSYIRNLKHVYETRLGMDDPTVYESWYIRILHIRILGIYESCMYESCIYTNRVCTNPVYIRILHIRILCIYKTSIYRNVGIYKSFLYTPTGIYEAESAFKYWKITIKTHLAFRNMQSIKGCELTSAEFGFVYETDAVYESQRSYTKVKTRIRKLINIRTEFRLLFRS